MKLLDESASVKELPAAQEDDEADLEREDGLGDGSAPSSVKKKMSAIKSQRDGSQLEDEESAKKLLEAQ